MEKMDQDPSLTIVHITYLGANGVLELNNEMSYHENDSEDCIYIATKFKEFNQSSINSLPGKGKL